LHHPGWLVTRRTTEETRLGEWTLPAGTELAYCQHALHRDLERFPDPHTFAPDQSQPSAPYSPWPARPERSKDSAWPAAP
ncbi:cytochrome P450, partial [Streptomyces violarus]